MNSRLTLMAVTGMVAVVSMILQAATGPAWWVARGVVNTNAAPNDFAAVNQGQLKWMAVNAALELESQLPGGAGSNVWTLIESFSNTNNFRPVNLGQLKYVASHFYDRLMEVGYTNAYPWSGQPNDYALANIGQMKNVFSFDAGFDTDGDGLPDWWETLNGFDPNDPSDLDWDSDEDGMPDWWEVWNGFDRYDANDAGEDADTDGLSNLQEFQIGTNPRNSDTDGDGIPDGLDSNPLSPDQENPIQFVVNCEGGAEDVWVQDHKRYKIPKGTAKISRKIVLFTDEWPVWTEEQSEYNDVIEYNVNGPQGALAQGSYMVNDLHEYFAEGEYPGGNWVATEEWIDVSSYTADQDVHIDVTGRAKNVGDSQLGSGVAVVMVIPKV